jgi:drug/metabolite transporter (DMT)-like permease
LTHQLAPSRSPARFYGIAALLAGIVCWGAVPVLLRHLTGSIDAWTANGFRYPLSAVLYWPILWHARRTGHLRPEVLRRLLVPALLALGAQVLWGLAPYYLSASAIGFYIRFALVWSVLAAVTLFPDERRLLGLPRFYVGMGLCVGGFITLSVAGIQSDADVSVTGVVIMLFCSFFFGLYAVSVRWHLRGMNPLVGFGVVAQYVSVGTLSAMLLWGKPSSLVALSSGDWTALIGSSLLGIAMGHFFLYTAVQRLGAAVTSGVQSITPFLTVAMAFVFLGESMTTAKWVAGIVIVAGAAVLLSAQQVVDRQRAE